jgi:hypothetical protein
MSAQWDRVTIDHVRQACEIFDTGIVKPRRPAQTTFLLLDGKTYPAKFIRGLAYRLATGIELNPNRYTGGAETVRFFQGLGLATQHGSEIRQAGAGRVLSNGGPEPVRERHASHLKPRKVGASDLGRGDPANCSPRVPAKYRFRRAFARASVR